MSFLELSGLVFWTAVFLVFAGYIVARVYASLYGFDPAPSVDTLILRADKAKARAHQANRPRVRASTFQGENS